MNTNIGPTELRIWAEVGQWCRGEHALVVMRGEFDAGQLIDAPEALHDIPLADEEWDKPLAELGYRMIPGSQTTSTPYGIAFDIEAL